MSLWILTDLGEEKAAFRCPFYPEWTIDVHLRHLPIFDVGEKPVEYCPACMFPHPLPGPYARHTQVHGKRPDWDPVEQENKVDLEPSIEEKLKAAEETIRKAVEDESRGYKQQDGPFDRDEVRGDLIRNRNFEQSSESVSREGDRKHYKRVSDDSDG